MSNSLVVEPIGFLRTEQQKKYELKPQPTAAQPSGVIELVKGKNYEVALRDLDGFDRIWLIWWFHKNQNWRPTTLPPRGRTGRKGTFATRSPYRPNPIAMSCVELLGVENNLLFVGPHDLLDETPILDIKPYMPQFDSFPSSATGWLGEMEEQLSLSEKHEVQFSEAADETLYQDPKLRETIVETLSEDPRPHRTRRIVEYDGAYRLACGDWRIFFEVNERSVFVREVVLRSSNNS